MSKAAVGAISSGKMPSKSPLKNNARRRISKILRDEYLDELEKRISAADSRTTSFDDESGGVHYSGGNRRGVAKLPQLDEVENEQQGKTPEANVKETCNHEGGDLPPKHRERSSSRSLSQSMSAKRQDSETSLSYSRSKHIFFTESGEMQPVFDYKPNSGTSKRRHSPHSQVVGDFCMRSSSSRSGSGISISPGPRVHPNASAIALLNQTSSTSDNSLRPVSSRRETSRRLSAIAQTLTFAAGNTFVMPDMTEKVVSGRSNDRLSSNRRSYGRSSFLETHRSSVHSRHSVRSSNLSVRGSSVGTASRIEEKEETKEPTGSVNVDKLMPMSIQTENPGLRGTPAGRSRSTSRFASHMRMLKEFGNSDSLYASRLNLLSTGKVELPFFIHPHSIRKIVWDLFLAFLVVYSVIDIPLRLAFTFDHSLANLIFESFIDLCFIFDMILSCFTAYLEEGKLIFDRRMIVKHYLRTWFIPDFFCSVPFDSILSIVYTGSPFSRYDSFRSLKLVKVLRRVVILRMLKLLRILKLMHKLENVPSGKVTIVTPAMFTLITRMVGILFFAHLFTCGWHVITGCSDPEIEVEIGWLYCGHYGSTSSHYLASMYWVIATMMGVGYGEISASNVNERGYALMVMLSGSVASGMIITSVSILVGKFKPYKNEYSNRMNEVKEYMLERRLPTKLQSKIRHHFTHTYNKISVFDEDSIHSYLTPHLYQELVLNKQRHLIEKLHFFKRALELNHDFVCMAIQKLKPMQIKVGEDILVQGDLSEEIFFVASGQVNALRFHERGQAPMLIALYREGHEFGLEALVMHQDSPATYRGMTSCDIYFLDTNDYDSLMEEFPEMAEFIFQRVKALVANTRKVLSSGCHTVNNVKCGLSVLLGDELIPISLIDINPVKKRHSSAVVAAGDLAFDASHTASDRFVRILKEASVAVYDENIQKVIDRKVKVEEDHTSDVFRVNMLLDPTGHFKTFWDIWIGILTVYSVIYLPVMIGFAINHPYLIILWLVVDVFFMVDCVLTFFTALELHPGLYCVDHKEIALSYLKTWFIFDLLSSIPWELLEHTGLKMIRIVRTGKFMKLFRIVRFFKHLEEILLESGINTYLERSILLSVTLSFIGHLFGCFFHFVAISGTDDSWTEADGLGTLTERYCASIYWAFTTMTTVGYGDIIPQSDSERGFVTVVMFLGATVFGYIVGTVSSLMSQMNHAKRFAPELIALVSDYLTEQHVEFNLAQSIKKHLQYVFHIQSAFDEASILRKMPRHLRRETLLYVRRDVIRTFAIFDGQSKAFAAYIVRSMEPLFCPANNFIYTEEEESNSIYFLTSGIVELVQNVDLPSGKPQKRGYRRSANNSHSGDVLKHIVEKGGVFGHEPFLGVEKEPEGARAFVDCCLFMLSKEEIIFMNERHASLAKRLRAALISIRNESEEHKKMFNLEERKKFLDSAFNNRNSLRKRVSESKTDSNKISHIGTVSEILKFVKVSRKEHRAERDSHLREKSFRSNKMFYEKSFRISDIEKKQDDLNSSYPSSHSLGKRKYLKTKNTSKVYLAPNSSLLRDSTLSEAEKSERQSSERRIKKDHKEDR